MTVRRLRYALPALLLPALGACSAIAVPPAPQARAATDTGTTTVSLRPGEQASLAGGSLRYLRLVNDSRCAPDVQCVWAGDAEIALQWTPAGGAPRVFSLHTGVEPRRQALEDGRSLRLLELARGPAPDARLAVEAAAQPR
jgi:hypothetical protein